MISKKAEQNVIEGIKEELINIKAEYGEFYHSIHEGYSVLLEEVEESEDEMKKIKTQVLLLWERIKINFRDIENNDDASNLLNIVKNAKNLSEEAIQVAAVAEKLIQTMDALGVKS